jgi:hypothetical protein
MLSKRLHVTTLIICGRPSGLAYSLVPRKLEPRWRKGHRGAMRVSPGPRAAIAFISPGLSATAPLIFSAYPLYCEAGPLLL